MDNYAGIKAICVLVRDDERLAPGSSTAAELDSLFHGVQRKTNHSLTKSLARATESSEAGHIVFP